MTEQIESKRYYVKVVFFDGKSHVVMFKTWYQACSFCLNLSNDFPGQFEIQLSDNFSEEFKCKVKTNDV